MFILEILIGSFTFGIGAVVVGIVFSFKYNKLYVKEFIGKGYKPVDEASEQMLGETGVYTA